MSIDHNRLRRFQRLLIAPTLLVVASISGAHARAQELFEEAVAEPEEALRAQQQLSNEERANQLYFSGRFVVDDADPVKSVPAPQDRDAYPVDFGYFVTSLFERGNRAAQRGEHEAAVKYFTALAKSTPNGALALRHLCTEYRALAKLDLAQKACGLALTRNGVTVDDSVQYVQLVVTQTAELTPEQVSDVESVLAHLAEQNAPRAMLEDLKCRLGARLLDAARLQACSDELRRLNVPAEKISTYVWALAMLRGNSDEAKRQLALARSSGLQGDALSSMVTLTDGSSVSVSSVALIATALLLMAAALTALTFVYRRQHKRARAS